MVMFTVWPPLRIANNNTTWETSGRNTWEMSMGETSEKALEMRKEDIHIMSICTLVPQLNGAALTSAATRTNVGGRARSPLQATATIMGGNSITQDQPNLVAYPLDKWSRGHARIKSEVGSHQAPANCQPLASTSHTPTNVQSGHRSVR